MGSTWCDDVTTGTRRLVAVNSNRTRSGVVASLKFKEINDWRIPVTKVIRF
jgi:hypothetical protein